MDSLPWNVAVARYRREHGELHLSPESQRLYGRWLDHFNAWCGVGDVRDITRERVGDYVRHLSKQRGLSPATVNSALRCLKAFFGWLVDTNAVGNDPTHRVRHLKVVKKRVGRVIFGKARDRFFLELSKRNRDVYDITILVANSGLRMGEATHLRAEHVDLENGIVWVAEQADHRIKDAEERAVGLNDAAREVLVRRLMMAGRRGLLFKSSRGKPMHPTTIRRVLREAAKASGWGHHCGLQLFRRTSATESAPVMTEQQLLATYGWSHPATAKRHYVEASALRPVAPPVVR